MRRALLSCAAIVLAIACGESVTEPIPDRSPVASPAALKSPTIAFATTTTEDGLSISTDKDDYQPGDTVHFTGSGWEAGDVLDIVLTDDPLTHDPLTWSVNVGEDGMFHDTTYVVDEGDLDVKFTLVATSRATGRSLTVQFTDGNPGPPTAGAQSPNPANGGGTATYTVTVNFVGNSDVCTVVLSAAPTASPSWPAPPPGGFFSFSPTSLTSAGGGGGGINLTSTLTVSIPAGTAANTYKFRVTANQDADADDCQGNNEVSVDINLVVAAPANAAPVLAAIGNKNVNEQALLSFTAAATDESPSTLVFSLANPATGTFPTGAAINPSTGAFTWTPSEAQGQGVYRVKVVVTDAGTLTDFEEIQITVDEVNLAPVLAMIGNQTVDEGVELAFTAIATDADLPANNLSFSLIGAPAGASINSTTGAFSFTPTEAQGPGSFNFKVRVTDDGSPVLFAEEMITVTVNEVNAAPVWTTIDDKTVDEEVLLSFVVNATDSDFPANTLTYSVSGSLPTGANFDPDTRTFSWTPSEAQGPGTYPVTLRVNDGTVNVDESFSITVNEVNLPPVLAAIGPQSGDEQDLLTFTATATDPDLPPNTLTFSLLAGTNPVPSGAAITSGGVFTWTPTEAQGPGSFSFKVRVTDNGTNPANLYDEEEITVTVNEVNLPPELTTIGSQSVNEGSPLTFTRMRRTLTCRRIRFRFSLTGAPAGAAINSSSGVFTWTPADDDPTGTLSDVTSIGVVVTDNGTPPLSDNETVAITVHNVAPVISSLGSGLPTTIIIGGTLNLNVSFSDVGTGDTHKAQIDCGLGYTNVNGGSNVTSPFATSCTFASIGSKTVSVKVTDDDGGYDVESHTILVTYNFSGFFAPVDRPNMMNVSKAGQAIPLKWRLTDASGQGIPGVTGVTVQAYGINCALSNNTDVMEEYAAGSSGLQDQGNGYYQFNWKTPTAYLGTCKSISLIFGAGGMGYTENPVAFFTFKK